MKMYVEDEEPLYGIKLRTGQWYGANRHWVDTSRDAVTFVFVTHAEAFAVQALDLDPRKYTVEPVNAESSSEDYDSYS